SHHASTAPNGAEAADQVRATEVGCSEFRLLGTREMAEQQPVPATPNISHAETGLLGSGVPGGVQKSQRVRLGITIPCETL
ncbi:hypothetical protein ABVD23_23520, partial [Xanthomonas euvesicatoria]